MIDPKEILKATQLAQQLNADSASRLSDPFVQSVPTMDTSGAQNASAIIDDVQSVGQKMLDQMGSVKESITKQLYTHQDQQRRSKTYDFEPDMSDLRPTDAQGFPSEMGMDFFAPFLKGGMKK